jgi:hypothetical protein
MLFVMKLELELELEFEFEFENEKDAIAVSSKSLLPPSGLGRRPPITLPDGRTLEFDRYLAELKTKRGPCSETYNKQPAHYMVPPGRAAFVRRLSRTEVSGFSLRGPGTDLGDSRPATTSRRLDCRPRHAGAQRAGDAGIAGCVRRPAAVSAGRLGLRDSWRRRRPS